MKIPKLNSIKAKILIASCFFVISSLVIFSSIMYYQRVKSIKKIEFRNVYFSYKEKQILENFNLVIQRNKKIGIVGRTGCGKSTLVKLILGLYQPQHGKILIDNTPLDHFKQTSITEEISIVGSWLWGKVNQTC